MNRNLFRGYYRGLDKALDIISSLDQVHSFIFCRRNKVHTAAVMIFNHSEKERGWIDQLAGFEIPKHLYERDDGCRVGIIGLDIPEKKQDFVRLYVSDKREWRNDSNVFLYGIGYYINSNGEVLGKKNYYADLDSGLLNVDYYDSNGDATDHLEEHVADPEDYESWGGPKALFDLVKENGLQYTIGFKDKAKKDQSYFLVDPKRSH